MRSDQALAARVTQLCDINSHTFNPAGVRRVAELAAGWLAEIGADVGLEPLGCADDVARDGRVVRRELGPAVVAQLPGTHPAARCVLLSIHLDTVFPADCAFQTVRREGSRLIGPGVVDAKGGLVVLLEGLDRARAAGHCPPATVVLNPDEEIGSPVSRELLQRHAAGCRCGLVFEPTFPDGAMVSQRKGSGTFTLVVRGRSAHVGRDFSLGRSALLGAARLADRLHHLNTLREGIVVNPGVLESGTAVNIVPDLAVLRVNVRTSTAEDGPWLDARIRQLAAAPGEGLTAEIHGGLLSPPRLPDPASDALLALVLAEAAALGLPATARPTGGTCDGNKLASFGLAVVDAMGPTGGELHSHREYLELSSLSPRAELLSRVLQRLARENL